MKITILVGNIILSTLLFANQPSFDDSKVQGESADKESSKAKYSFEKSLSLQGIIFHVSTTGEGSLRRLTIRPSGLTTEVNEVIKQEIEGSVVGAEVADLNNDGFPEVYIYVASAGSGAYGSLVAYSSNRNKSISSIYLAPLEDDKKNSVGYMGHDKFSVLENTLGRRFPIYKKEDSNATPTGGTRQLEYKLKRGEASWQLNLVKNTEFK